VRQEENRPAEGGSVTVIGAGIVGICCASYLQRAGFKVTVVDERPPGEGCSFGNAGIISPRSCVPVASPGMLWKVPGYLADPLGPLAVRPGYFPTALPWFLRFLLAGRRSRIEAISRAMAALHASCVDDYLPLIKDAGAPELIRQSGSLYVSAHSGGATGDTLANALRAAVGIQSEPISEDEIRQLVPGIAPEFKSGLFFPGTHQSINSFRLVRVLAEEVVRRGGTILRRRVTGVAHGMDGPQVLHTDGGDIAVERLVVAAGAWSGKIAAEFGSIVPLEAERGYHVMLPDPGIMPRLPILNHDRGFYATPMENGLRLAGTAEFAGLEAPPDYGRAKILLRHAEAMFPGLRTAGATEWMGSRPSLPDNLPVIDRSPRFRNVVFAFGHSHFGLMGAAVTGKLVAELTRGATPSIDLRPYRVTRF
jgi:D-amino-acid dehydrogenase